MWFYVVFTVAGALSLVGMAVLIVRKFSILSILNVEDLPEEQELARKKEILQGRVARKATALGRQVAEKAGKQAKRAGAWVREAQAKLERLEREAGVISQPAVQAGSVTRDPHAKAVELLAEAEQCRRAGDSVNAEEKLVEAISWDAKEEAAYRALAALYQETRKYDQALETYDFLAKMVRRGAHCRHGLDQTTECPATAAAHADLAAVYVQAGMCASSNGDAAAAADRFAMATMLMPMNPRYLDLLIESRLATGDRQGAVDALEALQQANPDNQKIALFIEKIEGLPEKN